MKKMKKRVIWPILMVFLLPLGCFADIHPTAVYTDKTGAEVTQDANFTEEAPLHVTFYANAESLDAKASLEWHFHHVGRNGETNITRYEENTSYDFAESGDTEVTLCVVLDGEVEQSATIVVTIAESHLEMPNAFSPNGDNINDKYGAKGVNGDNPTTHWKSIVDFHAYIFNRWGQKLYEWHDVAGSWDGTFNGKPCKDGVYFVVVKARGADGIEYDIRRDINLIRRHNDVTNETGGEE